MINYILLVLLCQLLFLTVYDLFFNKETFFTWNRIYLIVTPILSFLIPILKFEHVKNSVSEEFIEQLPLVVLNPEAVINQTVEQYNYSSVIANVFYIGLTISLLIFLTKLVAIILLIIKNETVKKSNYTLVL